MKAPTTTLHWMGTVALGTMLAIPLGCTKHDREPTDMPELSAAQGSAYTKEEVTSIASRLVDELEMPAEQQARVLSKLDRLLHEAGYRPQLQDDLEIMGITGVVAYRLGEGGAVLTVKRGKAVGQRKGYPKLQWYRLSGTDLGPQLAASREWGVFLVLGLPEGETLTGTYGGVQKSAAIGVGSGTMEMTAKRDDHRLLFIGAGAGVSLDVSGARLKIKEDEP